MVGIIFLGEFGIQIHHCGDWEPQIIHKSNQNISTHPQIGMHHVLPCVIVIFVNFFFASVFSKFGKALKDPFFPFVVLQVWPGIPSGTGGKSFVCMYMLYFFVYP